MLNLERLRCLQAVALHGSVNAAADALHITTSAVSQQLAKLEREVGQRMLERNGRGIRLTDAARLLADHAERILSSVEQAEADLEAHRGSVTGKLTISAFATAARGLLPSALRRLREQYPQLTISLSELEPTETVPLVSRGEIDIGLAQDWFNAPMAIPAGLSRAALLEDVADIMLPADHPLADADTIDLDDIGAGPWITTSPGSVCHDWLLHTLRSRGVEPEITHTAAEYPTQLALVAAGLGTAVIPRLGRGAVSDEVRMVRAKPALTRQVYAVWRTDAARRPAIRAAVEALRQHEVDGARTTGCEMMAPVLSHR